MPIPSFIVVSGVLNSVDIIDTNLPWESISSCSLSACIWHAVIAPARSSVILLKDFSSSPTSSLDITFALFERSPCDICLVTFTRSSTGRVMPLETKRAMTQATMTAAIPTSIILLRSSTAGPKISFCRTNDTTDHPEDPSPPFSLRPA